METAEKGHPIGKSIAESLELAKSSHICNRQKPYKYVHRQHFSPLSIEGGPQNNS